MKLVATRRDRVLLCVLVGLAAAGAYWLLALKPTLERSRALDEPIAAQQARLDAAAARRASLHAAREGYRRQYRGLRALYRAVPTELGMAPLLRELERAAHGADIQFDEVVPGAEADAAEPPPPASAPAAAPEGETAPAQAPEGLEAVPVQFTFRGDFFGLTDLLDHVQRSVRVRGGVVDARGRLIVISGWSFDASEFPEVTAKVSGSVFLAPGEEPGIAGASPAGPPGVQVDAGRLHALSNFLATPVALAAVR